MARKSTKHEVFLDCVPILETTLSSETVLFADLTSQCVVQGILLPGAEVTPEDEESFCPSGMTVREFLDTVANRIQEEDTVYEKFVDVLALGGDPACKELHHLFTQHPKLGQKCSQESASGYDELVHSGQQERPELTVKSLLKELKVVTKPIELGAALGVPQEQLEMIRINNHGNVEGQRTALFMYIASNHRARCITWKSIADAVEDPYGDLALSIKQRYCNNGMARSTLNVSTFNHLPPTYSSTPVTNEPDRGVYRSAENVLRRRLPRNELSRTLENALITARYEEDCRKELEVEVADKKAQIEENQNEIKMLEEQKNVAFAKIERLSGEKELLAERHRNEVSQLKKDIASREHEVNDLHEKCQDYQQQMDNHMKDISILISQVSDEKARRESFQLEVSGLRENIRVLAEQKSGVEEVIAMKNHEIETLKAERDNAQRLYHQRSACTSLDDEIQQHRERIEELTDDLQVRKDIINRLTKVNHEKTNRTNSLESEMKYLKRKHYLKINWLYNIVLVLVFMIAVVFVYILYVR